MLYKTCFLMGISKFSKARKQKINFLNIEKLTNEKQKILFLYKFIYKDGYNLLKE